METQGHGEHRVCDSTSSLYRLSLRVYLSRSSAESEDLWVKFRLFPDGGCFWETCSDVDRFVAVVVEGEVEPFSVVANEAVGVVEASFEVIAEAALVGPGLHPVEADPKG